MLWHIAYCHFEVRWSTRIQWDPVKQMLGSEELNLGWALPVKHHWDQSQLQPDDGLRHLTVHRCTNKNITIYKEQSRYRVLACYLWFTCIFFALFFLCVVQCSVEALRICPYKYMYIFFFNYRWIFLLESEVVDGAPQGCHKFDTSWIYTI